MNTEKWARERMIADADPKFPTAHFLRLVTNFLASAPLGQAAAKPAADGRFTPVIMGFASRAYATHVPKKERSFATATEAQAYAEAVIDYQSDKLFFELIKPEATVLRQTFGLPLHINYVPMPDDEA